MEKHRLRHGNQWLLSTSRRVYSIRLAGVDKNLLRNKMVTYFDYSENMKNTDAINAFLALGHESRLNVYRLVVQKGDVGLTPKDIVEKLGIPNATLSFHLKELANSKLVFVERQGRNLFYKPNPTLIQELSAFLMENCCGGKSCAPLQTVDQSPVKKT